MKSHKREYFKVTKLGGDPRSMAKCIEKASTTTIACPKDHPEVYALTAARHRKGKHEA